MGKNKNTDSTTLPNDKLRAAIYARHSSDGQREESIEGQLCECKEYAERQNMLVISTYVDRAVSARTDNRPEFQKMITDSAQKQYAQTVASTELGIMFVMDELKAVAKSMLRDRVTIDFVVRHTGLDESTVREIQEELNNEG